MRIPLGFLKGSQLPSLARQLPFPGHQLPFQLGHPTLQPPLLPCQALQCRDTTWGVTTYRLDVVKGLLLTRAAVRYDRGSRYDSLL